ncbi:2354_t:CDS:2, partial [Dentiscutata erythropus]
MSYLLRQTESGRYASNQEELYLSQLSSTCREDSFSELSVPDSPPPPYPGLVGISDLFTTAPEEQAISEETRQIITDCVAQEFEQYNHEIASLKKTNEKKLLNTISLLKN